MAQAFGGFNLSAEPNQLMRDRFSKDLGLNEKYADNEPYQKTIIRRDIANATEDELRTRAETTASRGHDWGKYQAAMFKLDDEQQQRMAALADGLHGRQPQDIIRAYFDIEGTIAVRKQQAKQDFGIDFEEMFGDERSEKDQLLTDWYELLEQAQDEAGNFWSRDLKPLRDRFLRGLDSEQRDYIRRNTNMTPVPDKLLSFLVFHSPNEYRRIRQSKQAREEHLQSQGLANLLDR